ncbi:MAG: hypothetical protein WCQ70_11130 [Lentimicrobiaceae bacterium]
MKKVTIELTDEAAEAYEKGEKVSVQKDNRILKFEDINDNGVDIAIDCMKTLLITDAFTHLSSHLKIYAIATYYNANYANDWKADWNNKKQDKVSVCYDWLTLKYIISVNNQIDDGKVYFATKELAQLALDNNKEIFNQFYNIQ